MIKIMKWGDVSPEEIFERNDPVRDVSGIVSGIINDVRERGDAALFEYTEKFDGAKLSSLAVTEEEIAEAFEKVDPDLVRILERAAANIRKFHSAQKRNSFVINDEDGVVMGQKVIPIEKVGLYVPGGTASYPSTVLMDSKIGRAHV